MLVAPPSSSHAMGKPQAISKSIAHAQMQMGQALPAPPSTTPNQRFGLGTLTKDRKSARASKRTTDIGRRARSMGQALPAPKGRTSNQKFAPTVLTIGKLLCKSQCESGQSLVLTIGKPLCKRQCESGQSKHRCEMTRPWTSPENQKRSDSAKVGIPTEHGWIRHISSGH